MRLLLFVLSILIASPAFTADAVVARNGTDTYLSAAAGLPALDAPGDVFAAGSSVALHGKAGGDMHAMGFSVEVEMPAPQDLYVAGGSVSIHAPVGSDLTATGFSVRTAAEAEIGGNARLAGGSVVVDGPVRGSLTATAGDLTLNSAVTGDVLVQTGKLSLGPEARIGGRLVYSAPSETAIPPSVIAPDKVSFRMSEAASAAGRWGENWRMGPYPVLPAFLTLLYGYLIVIAFLVVIGGASLLVAPELSERLRMSAAASPGASLLAGFLGLAMLFGLVPVAIMTIVGIPLLPFVVLLILMAWTLGYLLAAYAIQHRLMAGLGSADAGLLGRLVALTVVLVALSLLNFIPFLGWMINVALMLFGLGAMARPIFALLGAALPQPEATTAP